MTIPAQWLGLRHRRVATVSAMTAFVPLALLVPTPWGTLVGILSSSLAFAILRAWRCPRCHKRFAGAGFASWPDACATCGLAAFSSTAELEAPITKRDPAGVQLPARLRRFLAATQILSGALIMGAVALNGANLSWLALTLAESLGFLALVGGWLLWRDHGEGYRLTRSLQWLQLVKIQSSLGMFVVAAGFSVEMVFTNEGSSLAWNQNAMLFVGAGSYPFYLAVNVFAIVMLVLLAGAQPAVRPVPARSADATASTGTLTREPTV